MEKVLTYCIENFIVGFVKNVMKKPSIKTMRNKCDALLSPLIAKMYPKCLLCSNQTNTAHHHVHKSQSTALRYYVPNLINLCSGCHLALHYNESYYASKIVTIKGIEWFRDLEKRKHEIVKVDIYFYMSHYNRIKNELDKLSTV